MTRSRPDAGGRQSLRIIGGQWRGRKLPFPAVPGLRPTPDRVRETLFNWLQGLIVDRHCLDLFAGSGALGLEALSRGAASVVMVEQHPMVAHQLQQQLETFHCRQGRVVQQDALAFLDQAPVQPVDIVFLDPPFHQQLLTPCIERLERRGWLNQPAWIYLEAERDLDPLPLPDHWTLHRSKTAGQVGYHLVLRRRACEDGAQSKDNLS